MQCEKSIRESRVNKNLTLSFLQKPNKNMTGPEDSRQTDLFPEVQPSGGFGKIMKAMDVSAR